MRLVLLGAPGSGKGTQAKMISEKYNIPHISTGDIFRKHIKEETELGKKVKSIIDQGKLCPDELTVEIVKDRLSQDDCKNGYILDGFPRTIYQADELEKFSKPDVIINIQLEFEEIERRLSGRRSCIKCGGTYSLDYIGNTEICPNCGEKLVIRDDDKPETIKKRLKVYSENTAPLIDYYKKKGNMVDVHAGQEKEQTFAKIVKVLG